MAERIFDHHREFLMMCFLNRAQGLSWSTTSLYQRFRRKSPASGIKVIPRIGSNSWIESLWQLQSTHRGTLLTNPSRTTVNSIQINTDSPVRVIYTSTVKTAPPWLPHFSSAVLFSSLNFPPHVSRADLKVSSKRLLSCRHKLVQLWEVVQDGSSRHGNISPSFWTSFSYPLS